jgi:hypothetical protein
LWWLSPSSTAVASSAFNAATWPRTVLTAGERPATLRSNGGTMNARTSCGSMWASVAVRFAKNGIARFSIENR